jgi:hypothetical protein
MIVIMVKKSIRLSNDPYKLRRHVLRLQDEAYTALQAFISRAVQSARVGIKAATARNSQRH